MKSLIVGTAGHIDHGKSSLIRALTGTDPDRLKEEKERGITIDLGFAHMQLEDTQIGFVDVPGHERFVRNMLAGAGGIDAVLFVVAADESVMPQTREHLDICHLLGINRGIFVVTKIDMVDPNLLPLVADEIKETACRSTLENFPVVFVSNATGEGMETLRDSLRDLARQAMPRATQRVARLPIDRVFSLRGFGTVVTGTLYSGRLYREQAVEILPAGMLSRIRGLQTYGCDSEAATEGQRTAVNLQGVDKNQLSRGMTLTLPGAMRATRCIDANLFLVRNAGKPLRRGEVVKIHIGTQETLARATPLEGESLEPESWGAVQFRTQHPLCAWVGDRFIIRRVSPASTIGGGEILNPAARKRRRRDLGDLSTVVRLSQSQGTARLAEWILAKGYSSERVLTALSGYPAEYLAAHFSERSDLIVLGNRPCFYCACNFLQNLSQYLFQLVDDFQKANPLVPGMKKEELRSKTSSIPSEVFQHVLDRLRQEGRMASNGEFLSLAGKGLSLAPDDQRLIDHLERLLEESGVQPPSIKELLRSTDVDEKRGRNILFFLQQGNIAIKISEDFFIHRSHLEQIQLRLRQHFPPGSRFNVGQFKDLLGISRKHAIPFLEYFDRQRMTKRVGDLREVLQ
ncbi:MAG: selenocysteine-specific translation elongation factor [Acidobacteria bacterium]|nr:selenocysteine-specific translation elongation factor [Acidobacteriota bacterium]